MKPALNRERKEMSDPILPKITDSIQRALAFLTQSQLSSGEFPTYYSKAQSKQIPSPSYVESPFITGHILFALSTITGEKIELIRKKGTTYLMLKRRDNGFFSFFNNDDCDLDSTCLLNRVLQSWDSNQTFYRILAEKIVGYTKINGLYQTWMRMVPDAENDIEPCVNVNIVRFLEHNNIKCDPTIQSLKNSYNSGNHINGTIYYESGFALPYFIYTLPPDLRHRILDPEIPLEFQAVRAPLFKRGRPPSIIDMAMKLYVLSVRGGNPMKLKTLAEFLVNQECQGGGWPIWTVYWQSTISDPAFWGSAELTTALVVQALHQYRDLLSTHL